MDPPDRDTPGDVVGLCDPRTDDPQSGDVRGFGTAAVREAHEEAGIALEVDMLRHFAHWMPQPFAPSASLRTSLSVKRQTIWAPYALIAVRFVTTPGCHPLPRSNVEPLARLSSHSDVRDPYLAVRLLQSSADVLASVNGHTCFHTQLLRPLSPTPATSLFTLVMPPSQRRLGCSRSASSLCNGALRLALGGARWHRARLSLPKAEGLANWDVCGTDRSVA